MDILEALATLDLTNDEMWTEDGLPSVDVVAALVENDKLTRADIMQVAPEFTRDSSATPDQPSDSDEVAKSTPDPDAKRDDEPRDPDAKRDDESQPGDENDRGGEDDAPRMSLEERLAAELNELNKEMGELGITVRDLQKERSELGRKINYVGGSLDKVRSQNPAATGIQQYLASQNRIREERAERIEQLKGSGLEELLRTIKPAALDAAMRQRKPARGSVRPQFQPLKQV